MKSIQIIAVFTLAASLTLLGSCTLSEAHYIEVIGEAHENPADGGWVANVYFNGNEKEYRQFSKWFDQAAKEESILQSENVYYQNFLDEGAESKFNLNYNYIVTFKDKSAFDRFRNAMIEMQIPASVNYPTYHQLRSTPELEVKLLNEAINNAKQKISALTGNAQPEIISITQQRNDYYGEYNPPSNRTVRVIVRAKK
jgi:hypothetical protein